MIGIYKITNKINKKIYIGQSTDIYARWYSHKRELNKGMHVNSHLQNAWNKYGEDNFEFEIIYMLPNIYLSEEYIRELLDTLEIGYIKEFKALTSEHGYNIQLGGKGRKQSEETIQKKRNIVRSQEFKDKISNAVSGEKNPFYGKHHTEETRKKISESLKGQKNPMYGKHHTEETRKKISETRNKKEIIMMDKDGNIIKIFNSVAEASQYLGTNDTTNICKVCKGKRKTAYGYKWRYFEE